VFGDINIVNSCCDSLQFDVHISYAELVVLHTSAAPYSGSMLVLRFNNICMCLYSMYTCNTRNVSQTADAEKNANRRLVINKYLNAETLQVHEELANLPSSVTVLYCDSHLCVQLSLSYYLVCMNSVACMQQAAYKRVYAYRLAFETVNAAQHLQLPNL
jgi:hypothetical protein